MQNLMISIKIIVWCSKYLIVLANGTQFLPYKLFLNNWEQFAKWADFPRIRASSFDVKCHKMPLWFDDPEIWSWIKNILFEGLL